MFRGSAGEGGRWIDVQWGKNGRKRGKGSWRLGSLSSTTSPRLASVKARAQIESLYLSNKTPTRPIRERKKGGENSQLSLRELLHSSLLPTLIVSCDRHGERSERGSLEGRIDAVKIKRKPLLFDSRLSKNRAQP